MNLIFFTHPSFLGSHSMPRFAQMLATGMKERGHQVELWSPVPRFFRLPFPQSLKKWLGYIDQFLIFPAEVRRRLNKCRLDTLFVFTDQALGPWVPLVANRPHVIHCHDFLAQRSALGQIPEHSTAWTGRKYQSLIRRGYTQAKYFISISEATQQDLHRFLAVFPAKSEVVYNGLDGRFQPQNPAEARNKLGEETNLDLLDGYVLHVGGNQWYKNRRGVIEIYNAWRKSSGYRLPLLLVGMPPIEGLRQLRNQSPYSADIHFISYLPDSSVRLAYAGASVFLFPSLAEGFGWPIAEAQASGCPVVTTNEAPMSMVAGKAGFLIPRRPHQEYKVAGWAAAAARVVNKVLEMQPHEREGVVQAGLANIKRFDVGQSLDRIERIYTDILLKEARL